ncbi:unnamed protein product [Staurois parvus]|uniref:Uncharacterized protein n=1 Tax=Staurois parvus TaxID=386267 RepID=A0ABN9E4P5_9NEOB|nr:unnamed protein product [Staurois parvus]
MQLQASSWIAFTSSGRRCPLPRCLPRPSRAVPCHQGNLRMQSVFLPDDHRADWRPEWCQSSL